MRQVAPPPGTFTGFLTTDRPASTGRVTVSAAQSAPRPMMLIRDEVGSNSVEHRTAADVMRDMGCSDDEIEFTFGYIPTPFQPA